MKPTIRHLSAEGKRLFKAVADEFEISDEAGLRILRVACEAFDRAQAARKQIDSDGLTLRDRHGQLKPHPLLQTERDSRAAFLAGIKALNLEVEPLRDLPGRPPGK